MKIYISGALHASKDLEDARDLYDTAAQIVERLGASAFLPHKQTDPVWAAKISSDDVFKRDVRAIQECDAVVAFLNEPSHGVGAEVAMCLSWEKPLLPLLHASKTCSRFLDGLMKSHECHLSRYRTTVDLEETLRRFVLTHQRGDTRHDGKLPLLYCS